MLLCAVSDVAVCGAQLHVCGHCFLLLDSWAILMPVTFAHKLCPFLNYLIFEGMGTHVCKAP